jgi:tRNA threonylcarbamoyladenosine biosynthesis protein TsaB
MNILGIETATERLSAALLTADGRVFERHTDSRSSHCELLAGFITELAEESGTALAGIEGIAVSAGPGSFTGLRIGIATAMGLAYGLDIPACGVSTLAALAFEAAPGGTLVCPLIDAKRGEAYTAVYRLCGGIPEIVMEPAALPVERLGAILAELGEPVTLTGPAATLFRPVIESAGAPALALLPAESAKPSAVKAARLGRLIFDSGGGGSPAALTPVYLRRSDAELVKPKRSMFCRDE